MKRLAWITISVICTLAFSLSFLWYFKRSESIPVASVKQTISYLQVGVFQDMANAVSKQEALKQADVEGMLYTYDGYTYVICGLSQDPTVTAQIAKQLAEQDIAYYERVIEPKETITEEERKILELMS